ncbi:MAG: flagellar assembly protein FliW [Bacillota bacterium]
MQLDTSRFGQIQYGVEELTVFREGLLGFEHLKNFLLIPFEGNPAFFWLQSVEDGRIAFLITDPFWFFPDYGLEIDEELKGNLQITERKQVVVYTICTVPGTNIKAMTANLVGPLVINVDNRQGAQYILNDYKYHTKHNLFQETPETGVGS